MSEREDLTRWNRASLTRFRYVDGNAVEYLETLRQQLAKQFADPGTGLCEWLNPAERIPANEEEVDNETLIQRQQRLSRRRERMLDTYHQDRRDLVWETARTFARACHILTEHTNAYANEGYLGTATQWDHVRRLVEMLDYHPAPPASASTKLVLEAKESKSGLVKKGWQVKYTPPEGGDKVIFETLDDVQVHHELNGLRLDGFDKSSDLMGETGGDGSAKWSWVTEDNGGIEELKLSAGNVAVLVNTDNNQAIAVTVEKIDNETNDITLSGISEAENVLLAGPLPEGGSPWTKGATQLLLSPKDILTPRMAGDNVALLDRSHALRTGDVIAWEDVSNGDWAVARIANSDRQALELYEDTVPPPETDIYQLLAAYPQVKGDEAGKIILPLDRGADRNVWDANLDLILSIEAENDPTNDNPIYNQINNYSICYYLLDNSPVVGTVTEEPDGVTNGGDALLFDGSPGDLASGQWVVAENEADYLPLKIRSISEYEDYFAITFEEQSVATGGNETAGFAVQSLKKEIRKLQPALDESAMAEITLGEFISGGVANRSALSIQGVGTRYFDILTGTATEFTLAQLAEIEPSSLEIGVSIVRLNEFKTKAERVLRFQYDAQTFAPLSGKSLAELLAVPTEDLAGLINAGDVQASVSEDVGVFKRLYGPFEHTLYINGHDRNETKIPGVNAFLILAGNISAEASALLKQGRPLVLEHEDGSGDTVSVEVSEMKGNDLYLSRNLEQDESFTIGNLIIRANVVPAGHGEGKPEKILGSGDAMLSNQSFTLEVEGVAFTADATKSSGVAAAMDVSEDGQIWEQVSTLKDSAPGDHHYAIRMTEEGYVKILFGDGQYGRRLPSGSNNVRVRYRVGSGLAGNVPVGGLEKPVNPHPLIEAVRQPLQAAGGGDMEDVASLRENAPSTLLALERAVSLSDFSHLAAAQSSVWQAKAYSQILHGGRTESVKVVIVPAGGVPSQDISDAIGSFLQSHALPGVQVEPEDFKPNRFGVKAIVRVKTDEFVAEEVEKEVISALSDHFTLKNRRLGEHLYLSEVYKVVEGVQGVENSICVLNDDNDNNDDNTLQLIRADDERMVIYLDTDAVDNPSTLTVTAEEYLP